jgi:TolA-binding protein
MNNKVLLTAFLTLTSSVVSAQKKEDFIALQRDMAQMQDQMKELQKSQDEKMAALTAMVQQSLDASARLTTSLTQLQKNVETTLADQQSKVVFPVVALGTKMDQMSDDYKAVKENITALQSQMSKMDNKLADISSAIRTMSSSPVAPPPPGGPPAAGIPSAQTLWENANRDVSAGNDTVAMQEYLEYLKYFPDNENAPTAQFNIATIYDRADMPADALKAFNAVLEKFPENSRTPAALYWKGMELMKLDRPSEAGSVFREFMKRYPTDPNYRKAAANLHTLGLSSPAKTTHKQQ